MTAPDAQTVPAETQARLQPELVHPDPARADRPAAPARLGQDQRSSPVGNYDQTTAGAKAVRNFLDSQAHNIGTYATNPLWQVVDGPWKLSQFRSDGYAQFSAEPAVLGEEADAVEVR